MEVNNQSRQRRFAAYAWFVTALTLAVILWGAFVRASKSGDGCGAHWPLCNGSVVPDPQSAKTLVGAGLVLLRLVGGNASVARAVYLSVHLVNTFLLVAALALTAWWAARGVAERPRLIEFFRGRVGA